MNSSLFSEEDMNEALSRLQRAVLRMDEWIEQNGGSWLQGNYISYADIAVMPVIVRMQDINLSYYWDNLPKVAKWLEKIQEHSAFSKTFYHGSLLTEKYPHLAKNK
ncbi:glutathione S-transferase C-terminal domain-containing protein [Alphaproteobacteria bacterium]|nr:glutathione S-transferase C-terminal domain-containing protein [Alphaproteobacteria bacterium]